jgi:hypothetical protein
MTLRRRLTKLETAKPKPLEFMTAELREVTDELDRLALAISRGGEEEARAREELRQLAPDLHL